MEQKTEASQAVDELLYEHARAIMQLREYGHSHDRAENVRAAEDAIRAALKAQPAQIAPALLRALLEACDLAMKNTVAARVPECGDFGAIAQNLDYALSQLKAQPAPTEAPSEQKPFAWAYRAVNSDNWHATTDKEWAHAIQNMERKPLYEHPAPTEAAQYPNTPEIDALMAKLDDDGATRGAAFIELRDKARQIERAFYAAVEQVRTMAEAAQGEDSARLDAGCDCDSPEWCKNYKRCHRQVCGFELRGTTPRPV